MLLSLQPSVSCAEACHCSMRSRRMYMIYGIRSTSSSLPSLLFMATGRLHWTWRCLLLRNDGVQDIDGEPANERPHCWLRKFTTVSSGFRTFSCSTTADTSTYGCLQNSQAPRRLLWSPVVNIVLHQAILHSSTSCWPALMRRVCSATHTGNSTPQQDRWALLWLLQLSSHSSSSEKLHSRAM